jgi:glycosyltransferase involved in cell wall biosynthesis
MQEPKIALSMIVKASDDEAELLKRCLTHAAPHVDGIFLTITGENKKCEEIAKFFKATVSHFEWVNDFSAARNFAMEQITEDYTHWTWLDCDDVPRNYEKIRDVLKENPDVDAYSVAYLYDFDEYNNPVVVHYKERIFKNDDCVTWKGVLHEAPDPNRQLDIRRFDGIDVLHLYEDGAREEKNERNLEIAEQDAKDKPEDPRTLWNLACALMGAGEIEDGLIVFEEFIDKSQSDEEIFLAHIRISDMLSDKGKFLEALHHARIAIGMRPTFPDGYHMAGRSCYFLDRLAEARDYIVLGLAQISHGHDKPYSRMIVYNPRAYDYIPLHMLAAVYDRLEMPAMALAALQACAEIMPKDKQLKERVERMTERAEMYEEYYKKIEKIKDLEGEELRKAIDALPIEMQSHPMVCKLRNENLVKTESSGKDLVYYCGYTEEQWDGETARTKGLGGSEEAVVNLSEAFAANGWNVTVYNNCGGSESKIGGVTYKPFWMWNYRDKQDAVILWRSARALDHEINSEKVLLDLHDVIPAGELNKRRIARVDTILVKSMAHRELFPEVPDDKFKVVQNGIHWKDMQGDEERDPMLLINTSSPDRSMMTLVDLFAEVKKEVPEARLEWAYGFHVFDSVHASHSKQGEWKKELVKKIEETDGVTALGRIGHKDVAKLYQKAGVFAYPTAFFEIDCISARKAQAAGAVPVATDFAALNETIQHGVKVKTDVDKENWGKPYAFDFGLQDVKAREEWVKACVKALKNPPTDAERDEMRQNMIKYDWESIANQWIDLLS